MLQADAKTIRFKERVGYGEIYMGLMKRRWQAWLEKIKLTSW
jgi:hypothetical protein